jgi:hypothetical protein
VQRRLQPTSSYLGYPAGHRLKPTLQAKARATSPQQSYWELTD